MKADRDRSLVEHLATKVMGWRHGYTSWSDHWFVDVDGKTTHVANPDWNPLDSWADAGMVLDVVMEQDVMTESFHLRHGSAKKYRAGFCSMPDKYVESDSGPRAVCEAVAKATSWKEPTE